MTKNDISTLPTGSIHDFVSEIKSIISDARVNAVRSIDFCRVQMYWNIGRQFYNTYPIGNTLRSQLNWSQYKLLISIQDPDKREYYELQEIHKQNNNKFGVKFGDTERMFV